ncbi:SEC-C metal-binding domain-containing protein [Nocardia sp. NPDC051832]|uniref:SEC-C metal-binding domain-containing protein n=1 Tax=Nocardia sp. NPDC051832 TaxID=3155673 RepID=UPI0034384DA2
MRSRTARIPSAPPFSSLLRSNWNSTPAAFDPPKIGCCRRRVAAIFARSYSIYRGGHHAPRRFPGAVSSEPASGVGGSLSETRVKRGSRTVGVDKELIEKLGGKDPCPCGSGRRFQQVLSLDRSVRRHPGPLLRPRLGVHAPGVEATDAR